ncbi:MAG: helix-turn-helix domain-containing protein [Bdellovibrionales bacterium]
MPQLPKHNYYEVLELPTNAAQHEVTTAYDRAKRTYSGENPAIYTVFTDTEARELLSLIEEAYSVLGNKTLRSIYDQRLLSNQFSLDDLSYSSILGASKQYYPEPKPEMRKPVYQKNPDFEKEIQNQVSWTGEFLKRVREYKGLSIERISEKTKINPYYITSIEKMDVNGLPASVFVRGYVSQIAKELGLNEKSVADSYINLFKKKN